MRTWIEEIKSSTSKYLSNYLVRYTSSPCTSQAYFDESGMNIIYSSKDKILIKEAKEGGEEKRVLSGHRSNVTSLAISKKRNEIVSGGENGDIIIFCIKEGIIKARIEKAHSNRIKALVYSKNGGLLLSGSKDTTMKLYNCSERGWELKNTFKGHKKSVRAVAISENERYFLSGSSDSTIRLYNEKGDFLEEIAIHEAPVRTLGFLPNNDSFISGGRDKVMRYYQISKKEESYRFTEAKGHVNSLAISEDGRIVASGSKDNKVVIYNITRKDFTVVTDIKSPVLHIALHKNLFILCFCKNGSDSFSI